MKEDAAQLPSLGPGDFDPVTLASVPERALQASLCRLLTLHAVQPCHGKVLTIVRLLGALVEHPATRRCATQLKIYREALDLWTRIAANLARQPGASQPDAVLH
jgi:hypothetical protein